MNTLSTHSLTAQNVASTLAKIAIRTGALCACIVSVFISASTYAQSTPLDLVDSILAESAPTLGSSIGSNQIFSTPIRVSGDFNILPNEAGLHESFLGKSEIWANKWGVSAQLKQTEQNSIIGLPKDSSFFNLDVKRRFGSHDKSNIELGLGWQSLSIDSQLDASGPKVSLSGKYNILKDFQVYGATSYFPELEDTITADKSLSAYEFEAGLLYKPLPSVSLKAGYRVFNLDLEDPILEELGSTSGFLLGTDLSW